MPPKRKAQVFLATAGSTEPVEKIPPGKPSRSGNFRNSNGIRFFLILENNEV